jgi:hypothetical protein
MAIYKVSIKLYQTILQEFWEEFDTNDQEKWDDLKDRISFSDSDYADDLPDEAPNDPNVWFEAYQKIDSGEFGSQEPDRWISEENGTTNFDYELFDESGNIIL